MSSRSFKTVKKKRTFLRSEKKFEQKSYRWLIAGCVVTISYFLLIEPKSIGSDQRYTIFIFWIPVIAGMATFGWYRRGFLKTQYGTSKGFFLKAFIVGFYLVQGMFVSIVSFHQVAKMGWDLVHVLTARSEPHETLECQVLDFSPSGPKVSWANVDFKFRDDEESFVVSDRYIERYFDEDPADYQVKIRGQKGIWDYYLVDDWELLKRDIDEVQLK